MKIDSNVGTHKTAAGMAFDGRVELSGTAAEVRAGLSNSLDAVFSTASPAEVEELHEQANRDGKNVILVLHMSYTVLD